MVLLCTGIATAIMGAKADETYRLCGANATGFIRVGKHTSCIGRTQGSQESNSRLETFAVESGIPVELVRLSEKHLAREDALTRKDCGNTPQARDYGLRDFGPDQDRRWINQYNRDYEAWTDCKNQMMSTKYKSQKEQIEEELRREAKRIGYSRPINTGTF